MRRKAKPKQLSIGDRVIDENNPGRAGSFQGYYSKGLVKLAIVWFDKASCTETFPAGRIAKERSADRMINRISRQREGRVTRLNKIVCKATELQDLTGMSWQEIVDRVK